MSLIPTTRPAGRKRLLLGLCVFTLVFLVAIGVLANNGWLPRTDPITGKRTGWFGREVARNAPNNWNPFAAPLPDPTPQLSKEYIYAGSRLLAVEDANAGISPSPTPTPHGFEGDVAPRFIGDGAVLSNDVTIERQFVTALITPEPGTNEFQRADAAPRATLGDGVLDATDVVQVRRYVAASDPLTRAGGPTGPGNGPQSASEPEGQKAASPVAATTAVNREVRVHTATGRNGETVTVPVFMRIDVGEVAVAFTLEYDAANLSNPRLTLSGDLPPSSVLTVNTTQPGKIGILIDAEGPFSVNPRELRLVFVTFDIRPTAPAGQLPLNITGSLAPTSVSDPRGNLVSTRYTNGAVSVVR